MLVPLKTGVSGSLVLSDCRSRGQGGAGEGEGAIGEAAAGHNWPCIHLFLNPVSKCFSRSRYLNYRRTFLMNRDRYIPGIRSGGEYLGCRSLRIRYS